MVVNTHYGITHREATEERGHSDEDGVLNSILDFNPCT